MKIKTITCELPTHWACPLINGDDSGLSDAEQARLDRWYDTSLPEGAYCVDVSEDSWFSKYHDASEYVRACDVATFTFIVP